MAGCLTFAARRGGRPKRGGGGGIIGGRTIINVRGGVNASARCLHCGRSRGVRHAWPRPFEFSNEQLKPMRCWTAPTRPRGGARTCRVMEFAMVLDG